MELLSRAIASAAVLMSGTVLVIFGLLASSNNFGVIVAMAGFGIFLIGLYGCMRVMGIKVYSGQSDWIEKRDLIPAPGDE